MADTLPVVEEVLLPDPSKPARMPGAGSAEEHSDHLDYQPAKIFIRRLIRPTYVKIADREAAPVTAKLPPGLQDRLTATPGLIAHTIVSKNCDHLPYRQEKILATRHGVEIDRNNLCRWAGLVTFWFKPLYQRIHAGLHASDYQMDRGTPKLNASGLPARHKPEGDITSSKMPSAQRRSARRTASSLAARPLGKSEL